MGEGWKEKERTVDGCMKTVEKHSEWQKRSLRLQQYRKQGARGHSALDSASDVDGYYTEKVQFSFLLHPKESKLTIVSRSYWGKLLAQKRGSGSNNHFPIDRMGYYGRLWAPKSSMNILGAGVGGWGEEASTVGNSDWMTQTWESVILDGYDSWKNSDKFS